MPIFAVEARQFHFVQSAKEIHIESSLYPLIHRRTFGATTLQYDVIGVYFVPSVVPIQDSVDIRFVTIACHIVIGAICAPLVRPRHARSFRAIEPLDLPEPLIACDAPGAFLPSQTVKDHLKLPRGGRFPIKQNNLAPWPNGTGRDMPV